MYTYSVLYISLHRHDNGFFYPAGDGGHHSKVGSGAGEGFNINIPWAGVSSVQFNSYLVKCVTAGM